MSSEKLSFTSLPTIVHDDTESFRYFCEMLSSQAKELGILGVTFRLRCTWRSRNRSMLLRLCKTLEFSILERKPIRQRNPTCTKYIWWQWQSIRSNRTGWASIQLSLNRNWQQKTSKPWRSFFQPLVASSLHRSYKFSMPWRQFMEHRHPLALNWRW